MSRWKETRTATSGGRFALIITKPGNAPVDVTYFRDVPTELTSFSDADPFGDSAAVLTFPQVTAHDDMDSIDVGAWLAEDSDVDIWWLPFAAAGSLPTLQPAYASDAQTYIDPLTNEDDIVIAPMWNYDGSGNRTTRRGKKVWEGFVANIGSSADGTTNSLQLQCVGAVFQSDCYLAKPFYPPRPVALETLFADIFSHTYQPHLRTAALAVEFPTGWSKIAPAYPAGGATVYTPVVTPGKKWTGFSDRATGSWDHALTSFIQTNLLNMVTDTKSGVMSGNQWTVQHARQGDAIYPVGRTPVLRVRDRFRAPDFSIWVNTHGVTHQLDRDSTQTADLIYGTGTGTDGTAWTNSSVSSDGSRTDYIPLAAKQEDYPYQGNPSLNLKKIVRESYVQYGTGFNQSDAEVSAAQDLARSANAGWAGTITLSTDPSTSLSRWEIRSGMTIRYQGFMGSGEAGINLHIASTEKDPNSGTVTLTVDSRYRDLLTVAESIARSRDALTPVKQLQAGQASAIVEDVMAPWNYTAGSGFVPKASTAFFAHMPTTTDYPYNAWCQKYPPRSHPQYYVACAAHSSTRKKRWAGPIPVLTSEKGTIRRTEIFAVDKYGKPLDVGFHMSLYYNNVTPANMPYDGSGPDPFLFGAFSRTNPATGQTWSKPNLTPDQSFIVGWGSYEQEAGYYPGLQSAGTAKSGLMVDEGTWTFDNTNNGRFILNAKPGIKYQTAKNAVTIFAMFYAEFSETVYFMARLFRQEPGTS